jgi:phosphoribosylamine--glycine ligase
MNILLLGSGGREHALAWKIAQSPFCDKLLIAPGNAGTANCGQNIPLKDTDFAGIKQCMIEQEVDMLVVGAEQPLVNGIYDYLKADPVCADAMLIAPSQAGARLEGSKEFAKQFMERYNIPTASYRSFTAQTLDEGCAFLQTLPPPYVLKADGLAAGKGVLILNDLAQAQTELKSILTDGKFGQAGQKVIVEQFLHGVELSVFVLTDGKTYKILPSAKDYKRIGEADTGLNTGGMGSVSPAPFADEEWMQKVEEQIIKPTIRGLQSEAVPYCGFIFFGLINVEGDPYVIEYNVRMGDPETESVMMRIPTDLVSLLAMAAEQKLAYHRLEIDPRTAATVMLVSGGYPENYDKGKIITQLPPDSPERFIFHAGTTRNKKGNLITDGGRVLAITSLGDSISEAVAISNAAAEQVVFEGKYYRRDIGKDLIND